MASPNWPEKSRTVFGALDIVAALVIAIGVFSGLPTRWWPVDGAAIILIALLAASGVGLLRSTAWCEPLARIAPRIVLVTGLLLLSLVATSLSYLYGIYGALARGGATLFVLVAAPALPYLFALPDTQLLWLGPPPGGKRAE